MVNFGKDEEEKAKDKLLGKTVMDLIELLQKKEADIVDEATDSVIGSHLRHYVNADPVQIRERLKTLCDLTLECLVTKSDMPMTKYAEKIACQRFSSGFSLREVQTALMCWKNRSGARS